LQHPGHKIIKLTIDALTRDVLKVYKPFDFLAASKPDQMSTLLLKLVDAADGPTIRGGIMPDGKQVFSVYDFISKACQSRDPATTYARNTFSRLMGSEYAEELSELRFNYKFPGMFLLAGSCFLTL
jgi:hypothetical protein